MDKHKSVDEWLDEQDLARMEIQRIMEDLYPESNSGFVPDDKLDEDC